MAQRRGMHGVAAFFEGGAGGSQIVPAATHAVDENDVPDLGHTTKGDSHSAQASPKRVCRLCRQRVGLSGPASARLLRRSSWSAMA